MKKILLLLACIFLFAMDLSSQKESEEKLVDIVWLKDGSKLIGTIIKWNLETGMDFQLSTGAQIEIPVSQIEKVTQDTGFTPGGSMEHPAYYQGSRPYRFKETGWYNNFSAFLNPSYMGGAGVHHAVGYRFNRLVGVGLGFGIESNDFTSYRNIMPVYAELRGFMIPKKISPYYALKLGYGFGLKDEPNGTIGAKGGVHFSPELGIRFGAGDVSYYAGLEYKFQNATFVWDGWDWTGQTRITDKVSYRRVEFRTGLLF